VLWGLVGEEGMGRRCRLSVDFVFGCKAVVVFLFVRISFIIYHPLVVVFDIFNESRTAAYVSSYRDVALRHRFPFGTLPLAQYM
jgi:hypothetical protein